MEGLWKSWPHYRPRRVVCVLVAQSCQTTDVNVLFSCSVVSNSATPWTVAHQAPLSMGFSRQEYWSGLPCLSPGYLPNTGIEPRSPALQGDSLQLRYQGSLVNLILGGKNDKLLILFIVHGGIRCV